jgi:hypothetical protein
MNKHTEKDEQKVIVIDKTKDDAESKPVKRKRNRPDLKKFGEEYTEPGDNARYLRYARVSMDLPPIDISDPKQVEKRINEYFDFCEENDRKPNIKGLGNWLGVSRETVNTWRRGDYRSVTHSDLIKKAVDLLEEMWWDYGNNGKVNPASWIFIGKNAFGMRDQQEVVIAPQNTDESISAEDITKRYLEDGQTIPTTFTDEQN